MATLCISPYFSTWGWGREVQPLEVFGTMNNYTTPFRFLFISCNYFFPSGFYQPLKSPVCLWLGSWNFTSLLSLHCGKRWSLFQRMRREPVTGYLCQHFLCIHFHFIEAKMKSNALTGKRTDLGVQNQAWSFEINQVRSLYYEQTVSTKARVISIWW